LTQLENKPLGELLFSTPGVTKDHQQVCQTETGWGRRARYLLKNQPLLVSEFFLPALIRHEHERN
jgi:chorismate--pyruvate lyase